MGFLCDKGYNIEHVSFISRGNGKESRWLESWGWFADLNLVSFGWQRLGIFLLEVLTTFLSWDISVLQSEASLTFVHVTILFEVVWNFIGFFFPSGVQWRDLRRRILQKSDLSAEFENLGNKKLAMIINCFWWCASFMMWKIVFTAVLLGTKISRSYEIEHHVTLSLVGWLRRYFIAKCL